MLEVLNVAYPYAPVGPDPIGGAERIVASLDARLVRDGHGSIVLGAADSQVAGHLVPVPPHVGWIDDDARARSRALYRDEIARLCREYDIDVIHCHGHDHAPDVDLPVITTLHLPRAFYPPEVLAAPHATRVCVSQSQRRAFSPEIEIHAVIENGIPLERYEPTTCRGNFVLALGRICPEKGFELALAAAREARLPLVLAGTVFPYEAHHRYATEVLAPLFDTERRWIGPVVGTRKRRLLAQARCLVITSHIDEASSLVAMEALAAGTPVVAFARGALPEIIEHGRTGLLVDHVAALPRALVDVAAISSRECRQVATERFSASRMTSRYLSLYREHVRPRPPRRSEPRINVLTSDRELIALADEWDRLCDRCASATPFQRPGWLLAWRRWFGIGAAPRVAAVRSGGRLVALVPMELRAGSLRWIGDGITDYLDAIVEDTVESDLVTSAVRRAAVDAGSLELGALRPCSRIHELALGGQVMSGVASPVVALDATRIPHRVAYETRRLESLKPRWQSEAEDPIALLEALFRLHRARWASRGQRGVLHAPALEGFHRDAAAALDRGGHLRMIGFSLGGVTRAVLYAFSDHGRFMFYLSGFDPELARWSPGRLLIARAIERARDEGAFELDFLRGREPYKYEWGAVDRPATTYRATFTRDVR